MQIILRLIFKITFFISSYLNFAGLPVLAASEKSWEEISVELENQNPRLLSLKQKLHSATLTPSISISPPTVSYSRMGSANPFVDTMEQSYELSQKFPLPGRIYGAKKAKQSRTEEVEAEILVESQKLKFELAQLAVSLRKNSKLLELLREKSEFFKDHFMRLNSMVVTDQAQKVHLLESETEIQEVELSTKDLKQSSSELQQTIASYLGSIKAFNDQITFPNFEEKTFENLDNSILNNLTQKKVATVTDEAAANKSENWPDVTFAYKRRDRQKDDPIPSSHEYLIGIEMPFLWLTQRSNQQNSLLATAQQKIFEAKELQLNSRAQIENLKTRATSTQERIKLTRDKIIPLLLKRLKILHQIGSNDFESLDKHREAFEKYYAAKIRLVEMEADFVLANVQFEILTGKTL